MTGASGQHFINKCKSCLTVISQCRCPASTKEIDWGLCERCAELYPGVLETMFEGNSDAELMDECQRRGLI